MCQMMPEAPPAEPITEPEIEPETLPDEEPSRRGAPSPFEPHWPEYLPEPPPKAVFARGSSRSCHRRR